jgi:hypothetical protein
MFDQAVAHQPHARGEAFSPRSRTGRAQGALARLRLWARAMAGRGDPVALGLAGVAIFSALFLVFPGLDLAASGVFHQAGAGFPLSRSPVLRALRESSDLVLMAAVVGLAAHVAWRLSRRGRTAGASMRRSLFLLAALVLGPGLVVNGVLKAWWGRPRPVGVDLFGGEAPYQLVWRVSDWCQSNCSFVSGEASVSAWFVAAAIMAPSRFRAILLPPTVVYAGLLSLNRLAFGGHFLSDILLSWSISAVVFALLHRAMVSAPRRARRGRAWKASTPVPA